MKTHLHSITFVEERNNTVTFETNKTNKCEENVKLRLLTYEHLLICYNIGKKNIQIFKPYPERDIRGREPR